jgi:hypothetical protein
MDTRSHGSANFKLAENEKLDTHLNIAIAGSCTGGVSWTTSLRQGLHRMGGPSEAIHTSRAACKPNIQVARIIVLPADFALHGNLFGVQPAL